MPSSQSGVGLGASTSPMSGRTPLYICLHAHGEPTIALLSMSQLQAHTEWCGSRIGDARGLAPVDDGISTECPSSIAAVDAAAVVVAAMDFTPVDFPAVGLGAWLPTAGGEIDRAGIRPV